MAQAAIHIGVGGWDYEPWRSNFYPAGLAKAKQLEYMGQRLTATEINATYYKLQSPASFAKWRDAVPEHFRFAVKASRFCTNRKMLGEAGEAIARFVGQGLAELGDKLGPILWQFMATKRFDPDDFGAFLKLLPKEVDGVPLRHALEPRHESFQSPAFVAMARTAGAAIVFADAEEFPQIADLTGDFVYARLQRTNETNAAGYSVAALDKWARVAKAWANGKRPDGFDYFADPPRARPRETFMFVISGAKARNPAAAQALIARL